MEKAGRESDRMHPKKMGIERAVQRQRQGCPRVIEVVPPLEPDDILSPVEIASEKDPPGSILSTDDQITMRKVERARRQDFVEVDEK